MKKIFIIIVIGLVLLTKCFAISNFSKYINNNQPKINLYQVLDKYYKKQLDQASQNALNQTAQKYNTSSDTIQNILDWYLSECLKILNKLNIKECNNQDKNVDFECLSKCYNEIKKNFEQKKQSNISSQIINNALIWENNLNDWDPKNWPYDLMVDINNISDILFKKKDNKLTSWWNISMKQEMPNQAESISNIDDILQNLNPMENTSGINQSSENSTNSNNQNNNSNTSWWSTNNQNLTWNLLNTQILENSNFQIWNICSTENNIAIQQNQNTNYNPIQWISQDSSLNSLNENSTTFNVFDGTWAKASLLLPATWVLNLVTNSSGWNDIKNDLAWWKTVCWVDSEKLLSVCLQLIPSWPRWPVWGTTKVKSVEEIITKIDDDLKDIKQSFIIPSEHWDESLGIDFKHIELSKIMAFNIVLTKKPVFQYKRNNISDTHWKPDQWNKKDTQNCPNVPRFLWNIYTNVGRVNCNSQLTDINRYLFTNESNAKFPKWDFSKSYMWTDKSDTTNWQYTVENNFLEFVNITKKAFNNLDQLLYDWWQASSTLVAKSK